MKNGKLSIGIIGCGAIACSRHIPEIAVNPDVGYLTLSSASEKSVTEEAAKYKVKEYFYGENGWKNIINNPDVDGIIVCSPNTLHAEQTISALNAGKHVLVEKPMAVSLKETYQMKEAALQNNKILLVAHHRRHQNCYIFGKFLLDSGFLGRIYSVSCKLKQPGPIEWAPHAVWFYKEGGGVMLDIGIHMADTLIWYCQEKCTDVVAVTCESKTPWEQAKCLIKMESGCIASIDVAWGVFHPEKSVKIYCEKGIMVVDEYNEKPVQLFFYGSEKTFGTFTIAEESKNTTGEPKLPVDDFFINCIKKNDLQRDRLNEHIDAMEIVLKAIAS